MQQVIIYRSQGEANRDYFWNEMFWPWVADHWVWVLGGIGVLILTYLVINARGRRRF